CVAYGVTYGVTCGVTCFAYGVTCIICAVTCGATCGIYERIRVAGSAAHPVRARHSGSANHTANAAVLCIAEDVPATLRARLGRHQHKEQRGNQRRQIDSPREQSNHVMAVLAGTPEQS